MIVSTKTLKAGGFDPVHAIDSVELDFEDRRRRRATFTGANGTEFHVDLADAPTLVDGDGFELETGAIVLIKGRPERLVEFRSDDAHVITRVAWHLGNRHTPTQLMESALRIRDDYVLVELVKKLGAEVSFVNAAFQPEGGAYGLGTVSGHEHHDHGHAAGHDHAGHKHDHDHRHDHGHASPRISEEDRLMAETIARREARRAARAENVHVHGPDCGHDLHDHEHEHHDHKGHDHDHQHAHAHEHGDHDHHH